jgi:hypothetical protein
MRQTVSCHVLNAATCQRARSMRLRDHHHSHSLLATPLTILLDALQFLPSPADVANALSTLSCVGSFQRSPTCCCRACTQSYPATLWRMLLLKQTSLPLSHHTLITAAATHSKGHAHPAPWHMLHCCSKALMAQHRKQLQCGAFARCILPAPR